MPVVIAGKTPTTFELKSASLPMLALRLKSMDLDAMESELDRFYGNQPEFFDHDPVVIDMGGLSEQEDTSQFNFKKIVRILRRHRLRVAAVMGGTGELQKQAAASGFSTLPGMPHADIRQERAVAAAQPAAVAGALVVEQPLRSGQRIYAQGRDLVLCAMVNAGAEVIADGHIHVYAPLRGRAIAGASGWGEARIFAFDMQPELVAIAGVYRTSEQPLPDTVWAHAAQVCLHSGPAGDQLVFGPILD